MCCIVMFKYHKVPGWNSHLMGRTHAAFKQIPIKSQSMDAA
jgi:hypothetical protein